MAAKSVTVVGAGIVGLAIAREYARSGYVVTVIEKENQVASHQSGRNSGVIHAGPYYSPGSLKAKLCTEGGRLLIKYAEDNQLPFRITGKLIVSTSEQAHQRVIEIGRRAEANGVDAKIVRADEIREMEPNCVAEFGLHVKQTAIINYSEVARCLANEIVNLGCSLVLGSSVVAIREKLEGVQVLHDKGEIISDLFINAGGLQGDRIAVMAGLRPQVRIVPFRGEYFNVSPEKASLVNGLIYPAPNPEMPFLGVHLTKTLGGSLHAGPNALLSLSREGYEKNKVSLRDAAEILSKPNVYQFLLAHKSQALEEVLRFSSRKRFASEIGKLVKGIEISDLQPTAAGIRAQAMTHEGKLVDDFVIQKHGRQTHILNAPSPAATASMAIARYVRTGLCDN